MLVKRCWQAEYNATYNAFNDACPAMLKRGRAEAEVFPCSSPAGACTFRSC